MRAALLAGVALGLAAPAHALPPFAPTLADMPAAAPAARSVADAWARLAASPPAARQAARWRLARALLAKQLAPEALGVLAAMRGDEPDLDLVPAFARAHGQALAETGRATDALRVLDSPSLRSDPEACAWRLRAAFALGDTARTLREVTCADRAIRGRSTGARAPFVLAAAEAAIGQGANAHALRWLGQLPDGDAPANLLRGRALWAAGQRGEGRLRLERARRTGDTPVRLDAALTLLELAGTDPKAVLAQAEAIRFRWRGGAIERRALLLSHRAATRAGDARAALASGGLLIRYFPADPNTPALLLDLRARLAAALVPGSPMPLPDAAGLFWEYRDLLPSGAEGDRMAQGLAERLAEAGLYGEAAGFLEHQLFARAEDIAKGPLSVRVATLRLLAGDAPRALAALRRSEGPVYPDDMRRGRAEVEAVALATLGKTDEALAVLDAVVGTGPLRAEILWRDERWDDYVRAASAPEGGRLDAVGQTRVLRRAVALAMLGREGELAGLRQRYAGRFGASPAARAFDALTGPAGEADLAEAMSAMPDASPAGEAGDLLDAAALAKS